MEGAIHTGRNSLMNNPIDYLVSGYRALSHDKTLSEQQGQVRRHLFAGGLHTFRRPLPGS